MKTFIKNYEKNAKEAITEEMVNYLYENISKADELKQVYKEVLEELGKYDNNNYSKICIIINALKFKSNQNKILKYPYDIYYLNLPLKGKLEIKICRKKRQIKTVEKNIEYDVVNSKLENIGEENTIKEKEYLIKEAKKILKQDIIDIENGMKWKKDYKNYIIKTYGRWSKQYEDYMITLFDVGFLPIGPNLLLNINREHIKDAIGEKLEVLEGN